MRAIASPIPLLLAALAAVLSLAAPGCGRSHAADASAKSVIVLGFDGMDHEKTSEMMAAGRLPHLARLAGEGLYGPLETAVPPQSPVAWSDMITGLDGGGHGVFDFIHRDPATMLPYLSTSRVSEGKSVCVGRWRLPYKAGSVELLRRGTAFWEALEERGVETTIVRMPANFPPSGAATRELSGMGTPDLLGTYGTFTYITTDDSAFRGKSVSGGRIVPVLERDGVIETSLEGPDNPFLCEEKQPVSTPLTIYVDPDEPLARIVVGDEERLLAEGEWSDWARVTFTFAPTQSVSAIARFYLKSVRPELALYVSPLNHDPLEPAVPVSTPAGFAAELARATGRFYTQGMPEDTKALTEGVLTIDEFLAQARLAGDEVLAQYRYLLERHRSGLLFYYFGNLDQTSHILWRAFDPQHPAYDEGRDARYAPVLEALYEEMDTIVGETLEAIGPETTLIVMSDHGFTSWRRTFNLNSWLVENGYLVLRGARGAENPTLFAGVDWGSSVAYGLGINGLYLNLAGREKHGIVGAEEKDELLEEIGARLLATVDPSTGGPAVTRVYRREETYEARGERDRGPDLVVGYAKGIRCSNPSVLGEIETETIADNTSWWSGDHCMDHTTVPGILATNRPLKREVRALRELAGAVAAEFGVERFPD